MTRINVVPVEELTRQHLVAEYRELPRVFSLVRNGQFSKQWIIPDEYLLGSGHVTFFYDKLGYLHKRYNQLVDEMRKRGYNPSPIPDAELTSGIVRKYFGDYAPTELALRLNRERISKRLGGG